MSKMQCQCNTGSDSFTLDQLQCQGHTGSVSITLGLLLCKIIQGMSALLWVYCNSCVRSYRECKHYSGFTVTVV